MLSSNLQCDPNIITADLNQSYADFCAVIKLEIETALSKKRIIADNGVQTNRFNQFKPW